MTEQNPQTEFQLMDEDQLSVELIEAQYALKTAAVRAMPKVW